MSEEDTRYFMEPSQIVFPLRWSSDLQLTTTKLHDEKKDILKQYQARATKHAQTQKMYDQLKSKYRMLGVSAAALESADMIAPARPETYNGSTRLHPGQQRGHTTNTQYVFPPHSENVNGIEHPGSHQRATSGSGSVPGPDYAAMPPPQRPAQGHHSRK